MFSTTYNKDEKLWYGRNVPPLYNPKISVAQALFDAMNIFGPKVAQISDNNGIQMTFDEIRTKTIRAAQNLQSLGFKPKQTFAILSGNSHNVAPITFASISIGCPLQCLDPSFEQVDLIRLMNLTKPVLIFCDVSLYKLANECLMKMQSNAAIFTFGGCCGRSEAVESLLEETHEENGFVPVAVDGEHDVVVIVNSSGTTGASKALCISHAALLEGVLHFNMNNSTDILLSFSSLYWLSGVYTLVRGTLTGATRIITTETFSPELYLRLIEKYKVTYAWNPPHQIMLIVKSDQFSKTDLSSLKTQIVRGGKLPCSLRAQLLRHLPNLNLHSGYGFSEVGVVASDVPTTRNKDSAGKLADAVCVKVIDEDGNRCGPNVDGEICVKTFYKFLGYYGDQKATERFFDDESFAVSGDIGHFDDDGHLFMIDRKKDFLRYCFNDLSPVELEGHLMALSGIKIACVVGIPDGTGDLAAAVVIRSEVSNIDEKEVFDSIADHFQDYCKLRGGVYFVDTLPTTPSGKVQRRLVKQIAIDLFNARNI